MYQTGRTVLSSTFFRAAYAPNLLPAHQLSRMAGNSSPSVNGRAERMMDPTGLGYAHRLVPKLPCSSSPQKLRYCFQTGRSKPNRLE
jgi:hypothetical protein